MKVKTDFSVTLKFTDREELSIIAYALQYILEDGITTEDSAIDKQKALDLFDSLMDFRQNL